MYRLKTTLKLNCKGSYTTVLVVLTRDVITQTYLFISNNSPFNILDLR